MLPLCSVFAAISLDGFLTRPDGRRDWLTGLTSAHHDYGYHRYLSGADAILMSRQTMISLAAENALPSHPCIILSERPLTSAEQSVLPASCSVTQESPEYLLPRLKEQGLRHLSAEGTDCIQALLENGLISDITLTILPVLLGEGVRLFGVQPETHFWQLTSHQVFDDGLVQLAYTLSL